MAQAKDDLMKALEKENNNQEVRRALEELNKKEHKYRMKTKQMAKAMFKNTEESPKEMANQRMMIVASLICFLAFTIWFCLFT